MLLFFFSVINPLHVEKRVIKTLSIMMRMIRLDMVWMKFALPSLSAISCQNFFYFSLCGIANSYLKHLNSYTCLRAELLHVCIKSSSMHTVRSWLGEQWWKVFMLVRKDCWLRPSPLSALPSLPSGALEMPLETASSTRSISSLSTRSLNR